MSNIDDLKGFEVDEELSTLYNVVLPNQNTGETHISFPGTTDDIKRTREFVSDCFGVVGAPIALYHFCNLYTSSKKTKYDTRPMVVSVSNSGFISGTSSSSRRSRCLVRQTRHTAGALHCLSVQKM